MGCIATCLTVGNLSARADLTPISPFVGSLSENWESFFPVPVNYGTITLPIMNGGATIQDQTGTITEPDNNNTLGSSGMARAADGVHYAYIQGPVTTITFNSPVDQFGAYWATYTFGSAPSRFSISFVDELGAGIGSTTLDYIRPGDGMLEWHGWSSTDGIKSVIIGHQWQVMIDGLQADRAAAGVPEGGPGLAAAAVLIGLVVAHGRAKRPSHCG
jgi:hypothetical protein